MLIHRKKALFFIVALILFSLSFLFFSNVRWYFFWVLINIEVISCFGIVALILARQIQKKKKLFYFFVTIIIFINVSPIGRLLLHHLEYKVPCPPPPNSEDISGIILLGGLFDLLSSQSMSRPVYNLAAGRLIEAAVLAHKYPDKPLAFTGTRLETKLTKMLMKELGMNENRLILDELAKNTEDNAKNIVKMLPKTDKPWLLVTSAFHMFRSLILFQNQGVFVIPYPVDYHTTPSNVDVMLGIVDRQNSIAWKVAIKEWAGIINVFFPIPKK